jgi:hypothetical protein
MRARLALARFSLLGWSARGAADDGSTVGRSRQGLHDRALVQGTTIWLGGLDGEASERRGGGEEDLSNALRQCGSSDPAQRGRPVGHAASRERGREGAATHSPNGGGLVVV